MPSRMVCRARGLWPVGIAAIVICVAPAHLWGQDISVAEMASTHTERPFGGFDDSLTKAADDLLDSGPPPMTALMIETKTGGAPAANLRHQLDQEPRSTHGATAAAATRLNLLRVAIEPILQQSGVPIELAAVALVESGGRTNALSPKGALGLWQLMPATARRYGLRVDDIEDDRLDIEKSTRVAARYLSDLHLQFGSWTLALAGYNTGEQNVMRAISRSRSTEFAVLSSSGLLPLETRNYVPRVMAAIQSVGHSSAFGEYHHAANTTTVFAASNR